MKTIIISSSLSKDSKSFILCEETYNRLKTEKIDVTIVDARNINLAPYHTKTSESMKTLRNNIAKSDNIIIGMGVHCYSISDSLKIILDNCFQESIGKFFGILCAAGSEKSYLSTSHLTQICMNEWKMIQLPRIIYATQQDFRNNQIESKDLLERLEVFSKEFISIGKKLQ